MPDTTSPRNAASDATETDQTAAQASVSETDEQRADATIEAEVIDDVSETAARTAELEAAVADLRDRFLRSNAEMENLRRRTEREVQDARKYAVTGFARDLLGVADNLRRALDAAAGSPAGEAVLKALVEGVELTEKELLRALEKNGVTRLEPKGKPFDPHLHQAIFEAPDPSVPTGTVVQVMQEGYVIGERILRPAMVGVARGGPKPGAGPTAEAGAEQASTETAGVDRTA